MIVLLISYLWRWIKMLSDWIPVEDYLPSMGQPVIVSLKEGYSPAIMITNYDPANQRLWQDAVEAWMPAPNKYIKVSDTVEY